MFPSVWKWILLLAASGISLQAQDTFDSRIFRSAAEQQRHESEIRKLFESAEEKNEVPSGKFGNSVDPRYEFVRGLLQYEHYEYGEAEKLFRQATRDEKVHYLPAWQALIHTELLQKEPEKFLPRMRELAQLAADPKTEWIGDSQPRAAAKWLGEVCEYLKLHGVDLVKPSQIETHDIQITEALSPELVAAWVEGQTDLRKTYAELHRQIEKEKQDVKGEVEKSANRETAELKDRQADIDEKQENARRSAVEWKAWHDKQMKQTKTRLATLQKDYLALEAAAKRLNAIIAKMQFEIGQLQTVSQSRRRPRNARSNRLPQLELTISVKQQDLARHQLGYASMEQKALALLVEARKILAARQQATERYKNATGEILRQDETLARWEKIVKKSTLKAADKAKKTDVVEALEKRLTLVSSYFPLDFQTEKSRVLKSFEQP